MRPRPASSLRGWFKGSFGKSTSWNGRFCETSTLSRLKLRSKAVADDVHTTRTVLSQVPVPLIRAGAWFCIVLLGVLSWLPASLEKRTGLPGPIEHLFAYFCTAAVLTLAYPRSSRLKLMGGLIGYAALLEAGQ